MADTGGAWNHIDYTRLFPGIQLFRAFRMAIDIRKLALAGLALLLLSAGDWAAAQLPFAPEATPETAWPWQQPTGFERPLHSAGAFFENPWGTLAEAATNWELILRPFHVFAQPALLLIDAESTWPDIAFAWTKLIWALLVWSVLGGAVTRMVAIEIARDDRIGLGSALKFSTTKVLSFFSAPLLPAAGIAFFWLFCLLAGLVGRIPYFGEVVVGALWFVPLILGFLMALALMGVAVGWPLMYPAISAEGSDAFDGFSRAFSYVFGKPWHYLGYGLVAIVYGSLLAFFISAVASLVVYLAGWSVAFGMGTDAVRSLLRHSPDYLDGAELLGLPNQPTVPVGARLVEFWLGVVAVVVVGFVYSYFWTATTLIYFLLRLADDATELDEVYRDEGGEGDDLLPLVGVAASEQPVEERPWREGGASQQQSRPPDETGREPSDESEEQHGDS